jgi:hypothetical protein
MNPEPESELAKAKAEAELLRKAEAGEIDS